MVKTICPLCNSKTNLFSKDKKREYYICTTCYGIHVPKEYHLSSDEERSRYELHINSTDDKNYIKFISRIIEPIIENTTFRVGLDFGCGPGPILKILLKPYDILIEEYDLYFNNDKSKLDKKWGLIISTEVVEHLSNPLIVFKKLWNMLESGGIVAIMTQLYNKDIEFNSWYYKGDPTHIFFFTKETFIYLASILNGTVEFFDKDITILKKR